jgi:glycosyltransferase involved in cell wall biosynthesis
VASLRGVVGGGVLVDTGSSDGTVAEFERAARDAGWCECIVDHKEFGTPFPFATARNYALGRAREFFPHASHFLFLDCDETLEGELPFPLPDGDLFACQLVSQGGGTVGSDCLLIRAGLDGEFTPITHEAFTPAGEYREVWLPGVRIISHDDSTRRASGLKARHDVELLTAWCAEHPADHRAQYYLAQSLWNVAQESGASREDALAAFSKRIVMGGHPEETWFSMYMRAACLEKMRQPRPVVIEAYLTAYNADPSRNEPLCALWSYLFEQRETAGDWALMEMLARSICDKPEPARGMYIDRSAYKWRGPYMYGLALLGRNQWARALANLKSIFPLLPDDERIIARQAITICREKMT